MAPLLDALAAPGRVPGPFLVVAAHPDDECLGVGGLLPRLGEVHVLHVTDGAPLDPDRLDPHDPRRLRYAEARRAEVGRALDLAGVAPGRRTWLGLVDQLAHRDLAAIVDAVAERVRAARPLAVFTHAWEGGHPDHDAVAFAVREAAGDVPVLEWAGYHGAGGAFVAQAFLPGPPPVEVAFEPAAKAALLACFPTQREALAPFSAAIEQVRPAPPVDFTAPPHPGPLWYERRGWGDGAAVRRAIAAFRAVPTCG